MVSDLKTFTNKGCHIAAKKMVIGEFCLTEQDFFGISATINIGREILCLPYAGFFKGLRKTGGSVCNRP